MLLFDIETDGYLEQTTRLFCVVAYDTDTKTWHEFGEDRLDDAIALLRDYPGRLCAHNGFGFDGPAIQKLYGLELTYPRLIDSLALVRMAYTGIESVAVVDRDGKRQFETHSIEAWGRRLNVPKGEHSDFTRYTPELLAYCRKDVEVLRTLMEHVQQDASWALTEACFEIEQEFAWNIQQMMFKGVVYDQARAAEVAAETTERLAEIDAAILAEYPGKTVHYVTEKRKIAKTRFEPFNPNSRQQVAEFLRERYDWEPDTFTDTGLPQVSEKVLSDLDWPVAHLLAERFRLSKMMGSLTEGDESWANALNPATGRIHGYVNHCGAITSRCTHSRPNTGNIPSHGKVKSVAEFWARCRELFTVPEGYALVGADAGKLELVALAHYLAHWDHGVYAQLVTAGDVHEANRAAAGLESRDRAKTFIYAMNYGAGDHKLGTIKGPTREELEDVRNRHARACAAAVAQFVRRHDKQPSENYGPLCVVGSLLRRKFLDGIVGFKALVAACQERAPYYSRVDPKTGKIERKQGPGWIPLPDGRRIEVRSSHSALNFLLQGFGAVVMKLATNLACRAVAPLGARLVLHVHDEMQFEVPIEHAEECGRRVAAAITEAAVTLRTRCPLGAAYKVGKTWRETH